ncbi:hsp90 co-chaperone Cdc37 [Gaertneriomyces sp. JEL0708]|nr:hsp90 co-chaperone Cdc37 [Gaertneriomyces sp. JEL0708]
MPVDYSKWDKLELSDDEDFECHPNVDKASMVRWRQAQIHQQRKERKDKIAALKRESTANNRAITAFNNLVSIELSSLEEVKAQLSSFCSECATWDKQLQDEYFQAMMKDREDRWGPPEPDNFLWSRVTYEKMAKDILELLTVADFKQVFEHAVDTTVTGLSDRQKAVDAEIQKEEAEAKAKLTTDDIKEGFSKTILSKSNAPTTTAAKAPSDKTQTVMETIHSPKSTPSEPSSHATSAGEEDDADYITYPPAQEFSEFTDLDKSYEFLGKHPEIVTQKHSDMILAEAFRKEMEGQPGAAQRCVKQALLLQYCSLLGKDGVSLFFHRIRSGSHSAGQMFYKDVEDTYKRIHERVKVLNAKQQQEEEAEQATLRQRLEACTQPDGTLKLPITDESTDDEKKRAQVFETLPHNFQKALLLQDVDGINDYLSSLSREEGEAVVKECNDVGLLTLQIEDDDEE